MVQDYVTTKLPTTEEEIAKMSREYSIFTWQKQEEVYPMAVKKAEGCYFWDYNGNKYFDAASICMNLNIGYGNKKVIEAMKAQLDTTVLHVSPSNTTNVRAALAKKIIKEFAPDNMAKVMFAQGGSDANEFAIRMAKLYTGRTKILSQYDSYHGCSYGSANLSGEHDRSTPMPPIAGFVKFFGPNYINENPIKFESDEEESAFYLQLLESQILREGPEQIAAIFFETITGSAGAVVPPQGYYKGVRELCDKYGILLIFDEVMVGFGRTGKNFAFEHYDVKPDMFTFAKGITSGYIPLSGVVISKEISKFFDKVNINTGETYTSHALQMACGIACLEVMQEEHLVENSAKMGQYLEDGLKELMKKHPSMLTIRGKGLWQTVRYNKALCTSEILDEVCEMYVMKGIMPAVHGGQVLLAPPLIVTKEEIDYLLQVTDEIQTEMDKKL